MYLSSYLAEKSKKGALMLKSHQDDIMIDELEEAVPLKLALNKRKRSDILPVTPRKSPPKPAKRKKLQCRSDIEKASAAIISSSSKKTPQGSKIVEKA